MSLRFFASLAAASLLIGCHASDPPSPAADKGGAPAPAPRAAASAGARQFGAPLVPAQPMTLGRVLSSPDQFANQTVTVEAKVRRNCTRRGCWMELAETLDPAAPGCRVTFKDYGFFVPLDSAGSTARVQGTVEVQTIAAGDVAHLEGEGAKFANKGPDGTAREVRMVASGVELWRDKT